MKIVVSNGYTYDAGHHKVKVGDIAILPTVSWLVDVHGPTWKSEVTSLKSDYLGPCNTIIGIEKSQPKTIKPKTKK